MNIVYFMVKSFCLEFYHFSIHYLNINEFLDSFEHLINIQCHIKLER